MHRTTQSTQTIHRTTQLIMCFYNLYTLHETCHIYTTWDQRNESKALFQNEKKKKLRASESCENVWTWARESKMKTKETKPYGAEMTRTFQEH